MDRRPGRRRHRRHEFHRQDVGQLHAAGHSQRAIDLLGKEFPQASAGNASARVVFEAPDGQKLASATYKAEVEALVAKLEKSPQVSSVSDPFASGQTSKSGTIGFAGVTYKVVQADVSDAAHDVQTAVVAQGEKAGLTVSLGGDAVAEKAASKAAELIGLGVAAVALVITFGSMTAAGLPLLTAILGVGAAILSITVATQFFDISSQTSALALMLGLAVAIDYALFIVSRYRNEIRDGHDPEEACGRALGTAGSAVVFAGLTVIIALAGLSVIGIQMLTSMGLGSAFAVAVAVATRARPYRPPGRTRLRPRTAVAGRTPPTLARHHQPLPGSAPARHVTRRAISTPPAPTGFAGPVEVEDGTPIVRRTRPPWQGRTMPFDHNDHYHRLLLRHVPRNCGAALDVGCGTGRFARRLAHLGTAVDAIDPSEESIAEARALSGRMAGGGNPRFQHANVTETELPKAHYDFISCLASIHHMPFDTAAALRDTLAPGGVLVILGCYPEKTPLDWAWSLAAVPVNAVARLTVAVKDSLRPAAASTGRGQVKAPVSQPTMPLLQIRREAAVLLPGCSIRRLLFWRYLLVFRNNR